MVLYNRQYITSNTVFMYLLSGFLIALFVPVTPVENPAKDWWENGNFYQIYPRSFKDSNNDGIGDLRGILEKLPYLKELGITGTWLSPIFTSPMFDFGYDISDYESIQPEYGTMKDFDELVEKCQELDIKLILDFVPNHTSDEHEWFKKSIDNDSIYKDFYIWHPGRIVNNQRLPPNNWLSAMRNSAWEWNDKRQAYYLHQFSIKQPDLNYRNPHVVEKMKDVIKFWLARGIAGFRIDAVSTLFEIDTDENGMYLDEPLSGICTNDPAAHCYLNHIYTENLDESIEMVYQWRDVMDKFKQLNGGETRILMTEAFSSELGRYILFYGNDRRNGSNIPFNFELLFRTNRSSTALDYKNVIDSWLNEMPNGVQANWVLGNHDRNRIATRLGETRIDLFNILLKTLPGISITYNGEEIGMVDVYIPWEDTVDPLACNTNSTMYEEVSRDPVRTPFQWDSSLNAGFSTALKTWLPVGPDFQMVNVKLQQAANRSHLKVFQKLNQLRELSSLNYGNYEPKVFRNVLIYKRHTPGSSPIITALNFGDVAESINMKTLYENFPNQLHVLVSSIRSQYREGDIVSSESVIIEADVGVVFNNGILIIISRFVILCSLISHLLLNVFL